MRLIATLLLAVAAQAATVTSNGTGGGNWADGATWVGGTPPGNGDSAVIANGDLVTIPAATTVTVGTSPTSDTGSAIGCSSTSGTGQLAVNGTLIFRGPIRQCNATWTIGAGATLTHDSSLGSSASYSWQIGLVAGTTLAYAVLQMNGTAVSHITVGNAVGSGSFAGFKGYSTSGADTGQIRGTYVDMDGVGPGGAAMYCNLHSVVGIFTIDHFKLTNSGAIQVNEMNVASTWAVTNTSITSPSLPASKIAVEVIGYMAAMPRFARAGSRTFTGNYIRPGTVKLSSATPSGTTANVGIDVGMTFQDNVIIQESGSIGPFTVGNYPCFYGETWKNNLLYLYVPSGTSLPPTSLPCGSMYRTYHLQGSAGGVPINYHFGMARGGVDLDVYENIFEPQQSAGGASDAIQTSYGARAYYVNVERSLFLTGADESGGMSIVNQSQSGSYACNGTTYFCPKIRALRNTIRGTGAVSSACGFGGESNPGYTGLYEEIRDNIFSNPVNGAGCIVGWHVADPAAGTFQQVDYNWRHNYSTALLEQNSTNDAYTNPTTPGTHDTTGDPAFADTTRRFLTWCQSITPGDSTWDTCLAHFDPAGGTYNSAYTVSGLIDWVMAGYLPGNAATLTAGKDGGPVGAAIAAKPAVPTVLSGLSTSTAIWSPYAVTPAMPNPGASYTDIYHDNNGSSVSILRLPAPTTCTINAWNASYVYTPERPVSYNGGYWMVLLSYGGKSTAGVAPSEGAVWTQLADLAAACAVRSQFPDYSQKQAWNRNSTIFYVENGDDVMFYNAGTPPTFYKRIANIMAANTGDPVWSADADDEIFYRSYLTMYKLNVTSGAITTIKTFDATGTVCPVGTDYVMNGGSGNPSTDQRYWGMFCSDNGVETAFFVYDKQADSVGTVINVASYCGSQIGIDWVGMSPTGKYMVVAWVNNTLRENTWTKCHGVELFNRADMSSKGMVYAIDGHNDVGMDINGYEIMVARSGNYFSSLDDILRTFMIHVVRLDDVTVPDSRQSWVSSRDKRYWLPCSASGFSQITSHPYFGCNSTSLGGDTTHMSGRASMNAGSKGWFLNSGFTDYLQLNPPKENTGFGMNENVFYGVDSTLPTLSYLPFRRASRVITSRSNAESHPQCTPGVDYFQEAHTTVSPDLSKFIWASSWLRQCGQIATLYVDLGSNPAPALEVTTTTVPDSTRLLAYSTTLAATGGTAPYTWDVSAGTLPTGLSLSAGGIISGTPTAGATTQTFTVRATDAVAATDTQSLTLNVIVPQPEAPRITTESIPNGVLGRAYSQTIAVSGTDLTWSTVSGLPCHGLDRTTDTIAGTPDGTGNCTIVIRIENATGYDERTYPISVTANPSRSRTGKAAATGRVQ